jgi:hypothetical protein
MKTIRVLSLALFGVAALTCSPVPAQDPPQPPEPPGVIKLRVDPHLAQIHWQEEASTLAQKLAKTEKEDEKREIRKKLTDILNQQFDQHIEQQKKELADLEKQIADLKEVLKKRLDNKSAIVDRRIDQLMQEAQGLGWNTSRGSHRFFFSDFGHEGHTGFGFTAPTPPTTDPSKRR